MLKEKFTLENQNLKSIEPVSHVLGNLEIEFPKLLSEHITGEANDANEYIEFDTKEHVITLRSYQIGNNPSDKLATIEQHFTKGIICTPIFHEQRKEGYYYIKLFGENNSQWNIKLTDKQIVWAQANFEAIYAEGA